ncbi:MAG: hypothetical protein ACYCZ1_05840 [Candidatus Humimicrobiaceae bacterium]
MTEEQARHEIKRNEILNSSISKLLYRFNFATTAGMIVSALYNIADTIFFPPDYFNFQAVFITGSDSSCITNIFWCPWHLELASG